MVVRMIPSCPRCDDTYWVCEAHDDRPWDSGATSRSCTCGAPGMPCPDCNSESRPKMLPGFTVTLDDKGN
jgi:hypothetical protein